MMRFIQLNPNTVADRVCNRELRCARPLNGIQKYVICAAGGFAVGILFMLVLNAL